MSRIFSTKRDRRYYKNLIAFAFKVILVIGLSLYFGLPLLQAHIAIQPTHIPIGSISPAQFGLEYMDVTLSTEDDLSLQGWYIPSANRAAVILVHASNGNRTGTIYHAALLAEHGYGVLLYDARASGESEGDLYANGWEDHLDVFAALNYLQHRPEVDPQRIGVLDLSVGAKTALYAASRGDDIAAVVAEGTRWRTFEDLLIATEADDYIWLPPTWLSFKYIEIVSGVRDPTSLRQAVLGMSPTPLFLIAAEGERATSQAYFDAADEPKTLWIRNEQGHQIDALFDQPEEYKQRVISFLDMALLQSD